MPYIPKANRLSIDIKTIQTPGELNYIITKICNEYLKNNYESYQTYNDIIGALEGAKLELYRRKISKYEDKKCKQNGDVYTRD